MEGFLHALNTQIRSDLMKAPISGIKKAIKIAHVQEILSTSEIVASNFLSLPAIQRFLYQFRFIKLQIIHKNLIG